MLRYRNWTVRWPTRRRCIDFPAPFHLLEYTNDPYPLEAYAASVDTINRALDSTRSRSGVDRERGLDRDSWVDGKVGTRGIRRTCIHYSKTDRRRRHDGGEQHIRATEQAPELCP